MTKKQLFLIAIPLCLLAACQNKQEEQSTTNAANGKTVTVEVVNPTRNAFTAEVQITGPAMPNQMEAMCHLFQVRPAAGTGAKSSL